MQGFDDRGRELPDFIPGITREIREGRRAAARWSLRRRHDGWGAFGSPSGADVHVMGFTHADFGPWGIRAEFTVFDETAIGKQILLHTGAGE